MAVPGKYNRNKLASWLIRITLVFSVFAFPGYPGNANPAFLQKPQTELFVSKKHHCTRQTISFKKAIDYLPTVSPLTLTDSQKIASSNYNRLSKVKFDSLTKSCHSYPLPISCFQVKTIPQSSDEENDAALKG